MEINQLRDEIVNAVKKMYPQERNLENRFIDLSRNVGEFGTSVQYRNGNYRKAHHDTIQHQIASVMVDLFLLSDMLGADIEKELLVAKKYFEEGKK